MNPLDPFDRWLAALEARHLPSLRFQDVRRAVQALSSLYVERREKIGAGAALDGAGKRAAFALYFSPLRFLLIRHLARGLGVGSQAPSSILDLGCGVGAAGAAWALESADSRNRSIRGIDLHPWAVKEAQWTYGYFGLNGKARMASIEGMAIPGPATIIAAFTINELSKDVRDKVRSTLLQAAKHGSSILIVEPIARRLTPWWDDWARLWLEAGGREDAWRFQITLPDFIARMDKAAGLDHRELKGRSLWLSGNRREPL